MSKLYWDEIVLSHDDQDGVEFFSDLNNNNEFAENFILLMKPWYESIILLIGVGLCDPRSIFDADRWASEIPSFNWNWIMISYLEILVRDCWYNIEMNVIYLRHWEV